jgi:hypothetical protein
LGADGEDHGALMPIPTAADHALGEIDTLASNILSLVRTMQHAAQKDRAKMRVRLRDLLESYVAAVMSAAPQ